jgi:hypothetical protein
LIFELQRTLQKEEPTTSYIASPTRSNTTPQRQSCSEPADTVQQGRWEKTVQDRRQTLNVQYSNIESNPRRCGINLKAQYGCEQTLKSSINGEFGRPEMMKET